MHDFLYDETCLSICESTGCVNNLSCYYFKDRCGNHILCYTGLLSNVPK